MVISHRQLKRLVLDGPPYTGKWKSMESANDLSTPLIAEKPAASSFSRTAVPIRRGSVKKLLRPKVAIRLLGICFFGCLTGFLIFDSPYWMAGLWTALITAGLFYEAVRFVEKSERKL